MELFSLIVELVYEGLVEPATALHRRFHRGRTEPGTVAQYMIAATILLYYVALSERCWY